MLIVDDNATNRKLLSGLCENWSLAFEAARGAREALIALKAANDAGRPYDVVISDYQMPDIDGLQLAEAIQGSDAFPKPAVILLTSRGERIAASELSRCGLAACELKPIKPVKLRETILRALGGSVIVSPLPVTERPAERQVRADQRILIAEDNPVNQKVTLLQLQKLGYAADVVADGRQVLDALRSRHYDLILMDQQMPEMDGLAATRAIRSAESTHLGEASPMPIIAMTANAMAGDREICLAAGMNDYLSKPVQIESLREVLHRHLGVRGNV